MFSFYPKGIINSSKIKVPGNIAVVIPSTSSFNGGAYGIRTRDLIAASDARFQLR